MGVARKGTLMACEQHGHAGACAMWLLAGRRGAGNPNGRRESQGAVHGSWSSGRPLLVSASRSLLLGLGVGSHLLSGSSCGVLLM